MRARPLFGLSQHLGGGHEGRPLRLHDQREGAQCQVMRGLHLGGRQGGAVELALQQQRRQGAGDPAGCVIAQHRLLLQQVIEPVGPQHAAGLRLVQLDRQA
jgi:hypothetical protein